MGDRTMVKHLFNSRPNPHEAKGPYSQDTKLGHGKPLFKIEDEPGIPHCLGNPSKNHWYHWHFERVHDLAPSDSSPTNHHPQRFPSCEQRTTLSLVSQAWLTGWSNTVTRWKHDCCLNIPGLVNLYITMENHHFQWENPLFLWPFSIAMLKARG
jgi:hypothetical protein